MPAGMLLNKKRPLFENKGRLSSYILEKAFYTNPWAIIASATFTKPAILAPLR